MATPNYGLIPRTTLDQITRGLVANENALADMICQRREVQNLKGSLPFTNSQSTVRSRENVDLAPGAAAKPALGGFGAVDYNCLRQTGFSVVFDESDISADAFGMDLISDWIVEAVKQANTNTDAKLEGVLSSTTFNLEWDVSSGNDGTGSWDDLTNATPLSDIEKAGKLVPGANIAIVGQNALSLLQNHPQTQGRVAGYGGGALSTANEIQAHIAGILRIPEESVYLLIGEDAVYNTETSGKFEKGFVFNNGFFIGKRQDLQLIDPTSDKNRFTEVERDAKAATSLIAHHRYVDILRVVKENGITLTNIAGS